jgi:hypothetical protein
MAGMSFKRHASLLFFQNVVECIPCEKLQFIGESYVSDTFLILKLIKIIYNTMIKLWLLRG